MGKRRRRFVARAEAGHGWRVWDNFFRRWWGPCLSSQPDELVAELNGERRLERLNQLVQKYR
jgi:hypothetical protein